jgi:AraC-like DNA-binding protein
MDNSILRKWDYLHFLLFFIAFAGTFRFMFTSWEHKLEVARMLINNQSITGRYRIQDFLPKAYNMGLRPLQMGVYVILIWKMIFKFRGSLKERYFETSQYKLIRNWLYCFTALLTWMFISFSRVIYILIKYNYQGQFFDESYYFLLILAFGYATLNVVLLIFPQILYGLPFERLDPIKSSTSHKVISPDIQSSSEKKLPAVKMVATNANIEMADSGKSIPQFYDSEYVSLIEDLLMKSEENQQFLSPDFSLELLVGGSGIPAHHISYYFSSIAKLKFIAWRNKLRVEHAIRLMENGSSVSNTLMGIASDSGFTANNTFIRAFKNHTGVTPSEYLSNLKDKDSFSDL